LKFQKKIILKQKVSYLIYFTESYFLFCRYLQQFLVSFHFFSKKLFFFTKYQPHFVEKLVYFEKKSCTTSFLYKFFLTKKSCYLFINQKTTNN